MDGYIRVSRVGTREGPGYISPGVQREQIEGWAKLRSVEIAAWHEDYDQSGGKLDRPGLNTLLQRIENSETDGVIVAKLDRLSRLGVADALKLVERITDAGGSITAVDLGIDPTTTFGEFALTIMLALGRMERRRITESWAIAQRRAIQRGVHISPTPYGYQRGADGRLLIEPREAMHMRRAFELAATQGVKASADYLLAQEPERTWRISTVRRALARRVYLGETSQGDLVNTDAHEPLVSRSLWEAAQHEPRRYVRSSDRYPLSGIATCGTCGHPLVAGPRKGKGSPRRYRCSALQTFHKGPRCEHGAQVSADWLEGYVRECIAPLLPDDIGVADGSDRLALAERALSEAESELEAFSADLTLRRALGGRYAEHRDSRIMEVEQTRGAYRELARAAERRERVDVADATSTDPRVFAAALRSIGVSIVVAAGHVRDPNSVLITIPLDDEGASGPEHTADS